MPASRFTSGLALFAGGLLVSLASHASISLESPTQGAGPVALAKRGPGGAIDLRFGAEGRTAIDGMIPRAVTTDSLGRIIVVGTSRGSPSQPMLQRYSANGHLDTSYGERGSSLPAPVAGSAGAIDALVLGDGRTLLLGQLEDSGLPRPALWLVDAGGRFEPDWLQWTDNIGASPMSLTRFDGGAVMVALGVPRPPSGTLEGFIFVPTRDASAIPERLVLNPHPPTWGRARLELGEKGEWRWADRDRSDEPPLRASASTETDDTPLWTWRKGALAAAPAQTAVLADAPSEAQPGQEPGGAIFTPFLDRRPTRLAPAGADQAQTAAADSNIGSIGWTITGLLLTGLLWVFYRRRA